MDKKTVPTDAPQQSTSQMSIGNPSKWVRMVERITQNVRMILGVIVVAMAIGGVLGIKWVVLDLIPGHELKLKEAREEATAICNKGCDDSLEACDGSRAELLRRLDVAQGKYEDCLKGD